MKVLVTGARGRLGRALEDSLDPDHEVVPLSREDLDIAEIPAVEAALASHSPDWVVNAAAYTDVDGAQDDEEGAQRVNADGPMALALMTARSGIPILHVSTDYVFDGESPRPYRESDPTGPVSVYGRTKLAGEDRVREANPRHVIARTAWLYGLHGGSFPRTMLELAKHRDEVRVVDDQRGSPTYAPHLAAAIARLLKAPRWGVWHLAGSGNATWCDLTRELYRLAGVDTKVVPVTTEEFPRPAKRPANSALETERRPPILLPPWREGLAGLVDAITRS